MAKKCVKIPSYVRGGKQVKTHVRCIETSSNKDSTDKENGGGGTSVSGKKELTDWEYKKLREKEARDETESFLKEMDGVNYSYSGYSDTNGRSVYFKIWTDNPDNQMKFRMSDHYITNPVRVESEITVNLGYKKLGGDYLKNKKAEIHYRLGNTKDYEYGVLTYKKSTIQSTEVKKGLKVLETRQSKKGNMVYTYEVEVPDKHGYKKKE